MTATEVKQRMTDQAPPVGDFSELLEAVYREVRKITGCDDLIEETEHANG